MIQVEAFQEFRTGLAFLRGGDANKALPHLKCALEEEPANPFYISYMGVAIAATEQKWAEAEELCRSAIRMSRRQAQLYLNLAEIYVAADRKQDAADMLVRGLRYAPHDQRLKIGLDRLAIRRPPVLPFLPRAHTMNRNLGKLRHHAMQVLAYFETYRSATSSTKGQSDCARICTALSCFTDEAPSRDVRVYRTREIVPCAAATMCIAPSADAFWNFGF